MREKNVSAPRPGLAWITRLASRLNPQRQTAARAIADTVRPGGMAVFTLSVLLTATAAAGPPPPGPTLSAAQPGDEIRCDGQSCSFGACAAQKLFNDPASTSKYLRITPNIVDGQPRGLRLNGIRPDTWPGQLGLINGDIVVSLNGQELSTPESAVTTYLMLKDAPLIELALLRQG